MHSKLSREFFFFFPNFFDSLENVDIVCIVMDLLWNCPKFME